MKKHLFCLATATLLLASCNNPNVPPVDEIEKFTVTYMVKNSVYDTKTFDKGANLSFPADPVNEGYSFTGWYTSALCVEEEKVTTATLVNSDLTLYAGFEELPPVQFTVTFDPNGGVFTGETTVTVVSGSTISAPVNPTKKDYNFIGWSKTGTSTDLYNFSTPVTESFTLKAVWEEIIITGLYDIEASSTSGGTHIAAAAADDNETTYWEAANNEAQTLSIDFGHVKQVTHVKQVFKDVATWNFTIKGSHDGEIWVDVINVNQSGSAFEADCNGYFRYVKLEIPASENVATSIEFKADAIELSEGSNVVKNFKGLADCHAGGNETEKMFDGSVDTMHIENSNHAGHYCGIEANDGTFYYVKKAVFHMANNTNYGYYVDYEKEDGSWARPIDGSGSKEDNSEAVQEIVVNVNDSINALLYHQATTIDNWLGITEMEVIGFEDVSRTATRNVSEQKEVYTLSSLSYVDRIQVLDKSGANRKIEISNDGITYTEISLDNIENDYILVGKDTKYVRFSDDRTGDYNNSLRIFGTKFERNLAHGLNPTVDKVNSDLGFAASMATLNKNDKNASGRMYCAPNYEELVTMDVDLGKLSYVNEIACTVQDNQTAETLKFKIEIENNGVYTTLLDSFEAPLSGRTVSVNMTEQHYIQKIRITFQILGTWTNLNTLSIVGYGC